LSLLQTSDKNISIVDILRESYLGSYFFSVNKGEGMSYSGKGPCCSCTDRHVSCHSDCEKYLEWRKDYDKYLQTINQNKTEMIAHAQYVRTRIRKEGTKWL
jgi:hypothetical protein